MSARRISLVKSPVILESKRALAIHAHAMSLAGRIVADYLELFETLLIVESEKIYFRLDVPNLFVYCTELLQLSPSIAYDFITVVRKSLEVTQLQDAIRNGGLTVSKARKICPVINESNHKEWIALAVDSSCRVIEKSVARANPKEAVKESLKFVAAERLELRLGVSEEWAQLLTRTKDLLSQS